MKTQEALQTKSEEYPDALLVVGRSCPSGDHIIIDRYHSILSIGTRTPDERCGVSLHWNPNYVKATFHESEY